MKKIHFAACALLGLAGLCSSAAFAQNNTIRGGIVVLTIHSDSPDLSTNGPAFLTPQPSGLTVANKTTVLLGYTRKITDHWDFDLTLGVPPAHEVKGRGTLAPFGTIAKVKQAAPTAFANYNFGEPADKLRPFVGLGVNYTRFYDGVSTDSGMLASGGPTKISLKDSVGPAAQAGLNYKLMDHWSVGGSIVVAKVKSDLTATTGSIDRTTTIDFRPIVYSAHLGYSF